MQGAGTEATIEFSSAVATATGIHTVNAAAATNDIFDLQGRRVAQPQKGLYIMDGKKAVLK